MILAIEWLITVEEGAPRMRRRDGQSRAADPGFLLEDVNRCQQDVRMCKSASVAEMTDPSV